MPGQAAYLAKCDFTGSNALENVNCKQSNLSDSSLLRADASGANFTKANLSRVCFVDADLTGADRRQHQPARRHLLPHEDAQRQHQQHGLLQEHQVLPDLHRGGEDVWHRRRRFLLWTGRLQQRHSRL